VARLDAALKKPRDEGVPAMTLVERQHLVVASLVDGRHRRRERVSQPTHNGTIPHHGAVHAAEIPGTMHGAGVIAFCSV
jgi:hypothetical protein